MERKIITVAALMGMTAIILGAFAAHALKKYLSMDQLSSFETGVKYQMYHAFFLLFLGVTTLIDEKVKKTMFLLIVFGVFFFSGSIYLLTTKAITSIDFSLFGIVTPIGGALLIVAWAVLFWNIWKSKR